MFGDIAALFNLKVKESIYHVVQEMERLDGETILPYLLETEQGIHILPSPIRPEQSEIITGKHVEKILRLLKETHDYVIVDTPALLSDPVLALEQSDFILLINTLNIPVLRHNKTILEIMKSLDFPIERVRSLINRSDLDTGVTQKDVKTALGMEAYRLIPDDKFVDIAINRGEPLLEMKPNGKASKQMNSLAKQIIAEDDRKKASSWFKRPRSNTKEG